MPFLKLLAAVPLLLLSLGFGLLIALGGLWCALGFTLFSVIATVKFRAKNDGGRDYVYFIAFIAAQVLEAVLLSVFISNNLMGMHKIMDGYAAPVWTEALIAFVPVGLYVASLRLWASKPAQGLPGPAVPPSAQQ